MYLWMLKMVVAWRLSSGSALKSWSTAMGVALARALGTDPTEGCHA